MFTFLPMIQAMAVPQVLAQVSAPIDPAEQPAARRMIEDQLDAFRRDDAQGAWEHVAPGLRGQFGTAERFLEMVRRGYAPIHRHRAVTFGQPAMWEGEPAWWLEVTAQDGGRYRALYLLERQPDGAWRTSGCLLFTVEPPKPGAV